MLFKLALFRDTTRGNDLSENPFTQWIMV